MKLINGMEIINEKNYIYIYIYIYITSGAEGDLK